MEFSVALFVRVSFLLRTILYWEKKKIEAYSSPASHACIQMTQEAEKERSLSVNETAVFDGTELLNNLI